MATPEFFHGGGPTTAGGSSAPPWPRAGAGGVNAGAGGDDFWVEGVVVPWADAEASMAASATAATPEAGGSPPGQPPTPAAVVPASTSRWLPSFLQRSPGVAVRPATPAVSAAANGANASGRPSVTANLF